MATAASALPDPQICEQARISRDARFDGLFFTAVTSTGVYCRPVCPVRAPKRENIRYYPTAAAAEADGYRPCLRCRPELAPGHGWSRGDATVARALKLIEEGFLAERPLPALAARVGVGERQLRRLFVERLGATPPNVHRTRRLLFAKQLLTDTSLPIIDVALEAGFASVRRFNACFLAAYGLAPRELRRSPRRRARAPEEVLTLRLGYRPPFDFGALLDFLRPRALPGVEVVDDGSYARAIGPPEAPGWLRVSLWPGSPRHALRLEVHCRRSTRILDLVARVRRMFDLDADPRIIASALAGDPRLAPWVEAAPGLRLPGGWDGFEVAIRAVLGQQVSVAAARTLAARLTVRYGRPLERPVAAGLERLFPTPEALAEADFAGIGLTDARAATLREVAGALLDGRVDFRRDRSLEDHVARWSALRGIGAWTAHYVALRALGHADAFPAEDLILRRAATGAASPPLTARALRDRAERWRPWRAYAAIHLWRAGTAAPGETAGRSGAAAPA